MSRSNIQVEYKGDIILGEGPHWSEERQNLFFVDIIGYAVHRYDPATRNDYQIRMGNFVCFKFDASKKKSLCHDTVCQFVT